MEQHHHMTKSVASFFTEAWMIISEVLNIFLPFSTQNGQDSFSSHRLKKYTTEYWGNRKNETINNIIRLNS